jgi:plastocyanin
MDVMKKLNWILAVATLALTLVLASGCTPPPIQTSTNLEIQITEEGFEPGTVYVPAGQTVNVTLTNLTQSEHSWIILAEPYFSPYQDETLEVYFELSIPAGESQTDTFIAPQTGIQLDIICENEQCIEVGFRGRLVVVDQ